MTIKSYKAGKNVCHADNLSRLPLEYKQAKEEKEIVLMIELLDTLVIRAEDIARDSKKDKTLRHISHRTLRGWPSSVDTIFKNYWLHREEISEVKGCLMWGQRV